MKLIRDNTPGLIDQPGVTRFIQNEDEYNILLRAKLMEEAAEVASSTSKEELIEELGDLQEVQQSLMLAHGITREDVNQAASLKRRLKGGFDNGRILLYDPPANKNAGNNLPLDTDSKESYDASQDFDTHKQLFNL